MIRRRAILPIGLLLAGLSAAQPASARLVADLSRQEAAVRTEVAPDRNGAVTVATTDGDGFTPIRFGPGAAPGTMLAIRPAAGPWDWRGASGVRLHLQNAMPWPVTGMLNVDDAAGGRLDATGGLPPCGPWTLTLPLEAPPRKRWGLVAGPPIRWQRAGAPVAVALAVDGRVDKAAIRGIRIGVPAADAGQTLRVGKIFLDGTGEDDERAAFERIVDPWGQYRGGDWPERYRAPDPSATGSMATAPGGGIDPAFAAFAVAQEAATRARVAGAVDRVEGGERVRFDRYGGILGTVRAPAAGYFRTARLPTRGGASRWMLITPEGHPFLSIGVNAVQRANSQTFVGGRAFMFEHLPPAGDPLAQFAGLQDSRDTLPAEAGAQRGRGFGHGATYDFYRANLFRRDGADWVGRWLDRTRDRLRHWQFNTIGSWSDAEVGDGARLPYTRTIHVGGAFARLSDGHDWWAGIADPFDPAFAVALDHAVADEAARRRDDPYLIGYFIDNELGWGNGGSDDPRQRLALAHAVLAMDGHQPDAHAKRALVDLLRQRHDGEIDRLSRAWDRPMVSWEALNRPIRGTGGPDSQRPAVAADLDAFLAMHADRYFSLVATTLKRHAPNHLYLGARFASRTPQALAACAAWCDVVSFNLYLPSLDVGFETGAFRALGKPALLTEFHFGSSDRGPFWHGVMPVAREADRGPAYRRMLASVLANPDFVGAHWFQYLDQPVTGRWLDGENGHLGLVAITDVPWRDFVAEVAAAHREAQRTLYERLRNGD